MVLIEIVVFAILLIAIVCLWLRLDILERQVQLLRAQLTYHVQRPAGQAAPATPVVPASLTRTSPGSARLPRRSSDRPPLRLVKDR
jgi:hypothetical protein